MNLQSFKPSKGQQAFFDLFPLQETPPNSENPEQILLHGGIGCGSTTCAAIWVILQSLWYPEKTGLIYAKSPLNLYFIEAIAHWENRLGTSINRGKWDVLMADPQEVKVIEDRQYDRIVIDQVGYLLVEELELIKSRISDRGKFLVTFSNGNVNTDTFKWLDNHFPRSQRLQLDLPEPENKHLQCLTLPPIISTIF